MKKKSLVAVARKLVTAMLALWKNPQKAYDPNFKKNNKIFASGQAIPDAKHRGITPDLTRLTSEPDAKIGNAKNIKSPRGARYLTPKNKAKMVA